MTQLEGIRSEAHNEQLQPGCAYGDPVLPGYHPFLPGYEREFGA